MQRRRSIFMQRTASALWHRGLKDGEGIISVPSGVLFETPYSFVTRFENSPGTSPEELIAAALAASFTMGLSAQLVTLKFTPDCVKTTATATLESLNGAWTISTIHIETVARVPRMTASGFEAAAILAKKCCPVACLLKAEITMDARLEDASEPRPQGSGHYS